jgi:hypothetical protein
VWLSYTFTEANVVAFRIEAYSDDFIFGRRTGRRPTR